MIRKMSEERPRSLCHAEERGNFRVQFNLITATGMNPGEPARD